jgi:hypothetical protein
MLDAHASVAAHAHLTLFLWPRSASLPRPKHWNSSLFYLKKKLIKINYNKMIKFYFLFYSIKYHAIIQRKHLQV